MFICTAKNVCLNVCTHTVDQGGEVLVSMELFYVTLF